MPRVTFALRNRLPRPAMRRCRHQSRRIRPTDELADASACSTVLNPALLGTGQLRWLPPAETDFHQRRRAIPSLPTSPTPARRSGLSPTPPCGLLGRDSDSHGSRRGRSACRILQPGQRSLRRRACSVAFRIFGLNHLGHNQYNPVYWDCQPLF